MKKLHTLIWAMAIALPVHAQDVIEETASPADAAAEAPAADASTEPLASDETAPAADAVTAEDATVPAAEGEATPDAVAVPDAPAATDVVADAPAGDAPVEGAEPVAESTEAAEVTETPAEENVFGDDGASESTETSTHKFYFGAAYSSLKLSVSDSAMAARLGGDHFGSKLALLRAGIRVFDVVGLEVQGGSKGEDGGDPGTFTSANYFAAYIVPTGTLFDTLEIAAPIGYAAIQAVRGNAKERFKGPSYGLNLELPLRLFGESLPNLRFTAGYRIYYADKDARIYGYQAGLRFDFDA